MRTIRNSRCRRKQVGSAPRSKRRPLKNKVQLFLRLICAVSLNLVFTGPAVARSMDDQLIFLLENGCKNLSRCSDLDGQLLDLCSDGEGPGTGAGGNASSPQIAPAIVQDRLEDARGEEPDAEYDDCGNVIKVSPNLNLFFSVEGEALDRDTTHFEAGYDSDILRFTAGIDSQFTDKFLAGLALTYYNHDGDLHSGGDFENDSFGLLAYASFLLTKEVFIQATSGYASKRYNRTRTAYFEMGGTKAGPGPVKGSYDGNELSGGVLIGYDRSKNNIIFGPRASLDWVYTNFEGYTEKGNTGLELSFEDTAEFSLQSRLGMAGSMAVSTRFGVLGPQLYANWVHEFENNQRTETFSFVDDLNSVRYQYEDESPDRDFFELAFGVSVVLPNGWQTYAQYRTLFGHDYLDSHVGSLGMRVNF